MSIDFFLQSRKIYRCIEYNLKEIVELYKDFIELTENEEEDAPYYNKENDIEFLKRKKLDYEEKIKEIRDFKCFINTKIVSLCNHNMVDDSIDISPDLSKDIKYCTHCEYILNEK